MRTIAAALVLLLYLAPAASAQYFGQNKVQYDRFHFEIIETPHFDVHYYAEEREAALIAARLAERWYDRLADVFGHTFDRRQPIVLYASHSHFTQTSIMPGSVPEGVGGFTDHLAGRIVLPFAAGLGETNHVLGHEIVHAFQRDILKENGQSLAALPLWFVEGMAEQLSLDELGSNTRMWLRDAVGRDMLPSLGELDNPRWSPYRYGQALWEYLVDVYGDRMPAEALTASVPRGGAVARLEQVTGKDARALTRGWHSYIRRFAGAPSQASSSPVTVAAHTGGLNLAPALSPDGSHLVFLSDSGGYSLDVFLASSRSGRVERKLLSTATDPHFDSLQFIDSAGAWNASGDRFALASVRRGRPAISIFSMPAGELLKEYEVGPLDQIYTPTWSPDGDQLAFTGLRGGFADLYVMSLPDGSVKPLTSDPYSDLQPSWSPDGRYLAFTSDRFTSSLDKMTFGRYLLGLLNVETGAIEFLGGTKEGKSIDPQWCAESSCLYFVSDEGGVSNVYRLETDTGDAARVTDVATGVSGMTSLSPSISLGAKGERLAFAVYSGGKYEIRAMYMAPAVRTATFRAGLSALDGPEEEQSRTTEADAAAQAPALTSRRYSSRLSLIELGQPYMTGGGGGFGTSVRAGISMSATDLLGQHTVGVAVQAGRRTSDIAVETTYLNRRSRWNWGIAATQVPWATNVFEESRTAAGESGEQRLVRDSSVDRQVHREVSGLLAYPFSRARRIETSFGVDTVSFTRYVTTITSVPDGRGAFEQATSEARLTRNATSAVSSAALVYDNAVNGETSPLLGQRYRIRLISAVGDLTMLTAAADYRRYFMPIRGVTFAARVQHVVRSGPAVSDARLLPIVSAAREVVRGFNHDNTSERASRLSSLNVELRTSLERLLGRRLAFSSLPVELFAFSDLARFAAPRSASEEARSRDLWSSGAGARINAGGFVFELNIAKPQLEPQRGWHLVANFRPGF